MSPTRSIKSAPLFRMAIVAATTIGLAACGGEDTAVGEDIAVVEEIEIAAAYQGDPVEAIPGNAENGDVDALTAVFGATEIPYPVYPNGSKYRVGGENGLMIVVFQTEDSFDEVDAYYQNHSEEAGMPRLLGMNDYVRYSSDTTDEDPWATYRPGIVIHEFDDDSERQAVGAREGARTNIIMSFLGN